MIVKVGVHGCDDSTNFSIEATQAEFEFLKRVAEKCTATSEYRCQPTMEVKIEDAPQESVEGAREQQWKSLTEPTACTSTTLMFQCQR
jgi:hypothetical protein